MVCVCAVREKFDTIVKKDIPGMYIHRKIHHARNMEYFVHNTHTKYIVPFYSI